MQCEGSNVWDGLRAPALDKRFRQLDQNVCVCDFLRVPFSDWFGLKVIRGVPYFGHTSNVETAADCLAIRIVSRRRPLRSKHVLNS